MGSADTTPAACGIKRLKSDLPPAIITAYEVVAGDGQRIGYVWSTRGFSYLGTQGWNRGIRIRDFHPLEWRYAKKLGEYRSPTTSCRRLAVDLLVMNQEPAGPTGFGDNEAEGGGT